VIVVRLVGSIVRYRRLACRYAGPGEL